MDTLAVIVANAFFLLYQGSCESYSFAVAIVGPEGYGRPSQPVVKNTKFSPGAPPKNLQVSRNNKTSALEISWEASCPQIEDKIEYEVTVKDTFKDRSSVKTLSGSKETKLGLTLDRGIHFGTTYEVSVRTKVADSIPSSPVAYKSPDIPSPVGVTHHILSEKEGKKQLIYWHMPNPLPSEVNSQAMTFEVCVSSNKSMANPIIQEQAQKPPFEIDNSKLSVGQLYYVGVRVIDGDGYQSPLTPPIALESLVRDHFQSHFWSHVT